MTYKSMGFFVEPYAFRHVCGACGKGSWGAAVVGRTVHGDSGTSGNWELRFVEFCDKHLAEVRRLVTDDPTAVIRGMYHEYFSGPFPISDKGDPLMLFPELSPSALMELVVAARAALPQLEDSAATRLRQALESLA